MPDPPLWVELRASGQARACSARWWAVPTLHLLGGAYGRAVAGLAAGVYREYLVALVEHLVHGGADGPPAALRGHCLGVHVGHPDGHLDELVLRRVADHAEGVA